jgi:hypothetical protein
MSLITKPKAIIYCAENTISGKKYIGRTIRTLEIRKKEHFTKTVKRTHRFATALKCYPLESWKWYILIEVDIEKADEYELFFINDLGTYENGYNTLNTTYLGEGEFNLSYNPTIYHLYHFEYGEVSGTKTEFISKYPELLSISQLIKGTKKQVNGWVLLENKQDYEKITEGRTKIGRYCKYITMTHPDYGTFTLRQQEFINQFGLKAYEIAKLKSGRQKSCKNWKLVEEKENGFNTKD